MRNHLRSLFLLWSLCGVSLVLSINPCAAGVIYVDNRKGSDSNDGSTPEIVDTLTGPVRSIRCALRLAQFSDTIVLAKTRTPYYESISLVSRRHSGLEQLPFRIVGNGAIVDGSSPVPSSAWKQVGENLWKMTPIRKGHYLLLRGFQPIPEHRVDAGAASLSAIPAGLWAAWRGSIYYHSKTLELPEEIPFRFARRTVGLTLYKVQNVEIRDITFRHFLLDGINAHDLCSDVKLVGVKSAANGRAGLSVSGSSHVVLLGGEIDGNKHHSVLITEQGGAEVSETKMNQPPTVLKKN